MDILFIHPNHLGQFGRLAKKLAQDKDNSVYTIAEEKHVKKEIENITTYTYKDIEEISEEVHRYNRSMQKALIRADLVCSMLMDKKRNGFEPDIIFVHTGWGESFYLKEIFPLTPVVGFFEYYYHSRGKDVGFDPEFPMFVDDIFRLKALNAIHLLSLESCDVRISPTQWQKSLFPKAYQNSIDVIHEGIDTQKIQANPDAIFFLNDGTNLNAGDEVLTYVSRSLEPYRGYHQFIRALPKILDARPNCHVVIVGNDDVSYGKKAPASKSYKDIYFDTIKNNIDLSRVHFTGVLEYEEYLKILQISTCHVYLTYPFVLSWSVLEALSTGCVVVGSNTDPVKEVISDEKNGLLVDFFDTDAIAQKVIDVLSNPQKFKHLSKNAREFVQKNYDFEELSFKAYKKLIDKLTF